MGAHRFGWGAARAGAGCAHGRRRDACLQPLHWLTLWGRAAAGSWWVLRLHCVRHHFPKQCAITPPSGLGAATGLGRVWHQRRRSGLSWPALQLAHFSAAAANPVAVTAAAAEIRRMLIGRELFKESKP